MLITTSNDKRIYRDTTTELIQ